jgi:hypothetical protein
VLPTLAKCKPQILTRKLNTFTCNGIQLHLIRVHLPDETVACYDFTACAIRKHTQLNELNNLIYCTGGCITWHSDTTDLPPAITWTPTNKTMHALCRTNIALFCLQKDKWTSTWTCTLLATSQLIRAGNKTFFKACKEKKLLIYTRNYMHLRKEKSVKGWTCLRLVNSTTLGVKYWLM